MLVLSRMTREGIVLKTSDGEILIQVLRVDGPRVKIGVDAPGAVKVLRDEIFDLYDRPSRRGGEQ